MTYQTHVRFDDDLEVAVKAYAAEYGIKSIADAIRILVWKGLKAEERTTTGRIAARAAQPEGDQT